jgi:PAS domain S-box-containing protein
MDTARPKLEKNMDKQSVEINQTGERFAEFFKAVPMPLVITRISDGLILFANKLFADTLKMSPETLANHHALDIYQAPHARETLLQEIKEKGRVENQELLIKQADGALIWILVSMCPITFEGTPALLTGFHNITEHKQAELVLAREGCSASLVL